jgi:integrase
MATIRKLRDRWQAQVRRRGIPPRAKSFDRKSDAERWARELEAEADKNGWLAELLDLLWQDIDVELRVIHLRRSKNGDERDVPLSRRATAVLKDLNPEGRREGRVFPITGNSVRSAFERLLARNGISDLRFHDMRHEAISRLFEKGLNPIEVAAISGHRELRMLQRYTHLRATDLVAKLDRSADDWRKQTDRS